MGSVIGDSLVVCPFRVYSCEPQALASGIMASNVEIVEPAASAVGSGNRAMN